MLVVPYRAHLCTCCYCCCYVALYPNLQRPRRRPLPNEVEVVGVAGGVVGDEEEDRATETIEEHFL